MGIIVKERDIVVPGEILATGMDFLPAGGSFRDKEDIVSGQVGMVQVENRLIKVIPLSGRYMPKRGDTVIGKVIDITFGGWIVDIGCAKDAMLGLKDATSEFIERGADLTQYFNIGDVIVAKIFNVTRVKSADLTTKGPGLTKLTRGRLIDIQPSKVPRVIGKQGSMVTMIKEMTSTRITVGQNGKVQIIAQDPEMELIAVEVIRLIEANAHKQGLTEEIKKFLDKNLKGKNISSGVSLDKVKVPNVGLETKTSERKELPLKEQLLEKKIEKKNIVELKKNVQEKI